MDKPSRFLSRLRQRSVAEPGGLIDRFRPRVSLLGVEAVIAYVLNYFLSHVLPIPQVPPGVAQDALYAYYLVGYGFIAALSAIAYYWLWRPVKNFRENDSRLFAVLNDSIATLRTRAMREDAQHPPADYPDLESMVLGGAVGSKVVDCFEDVKAYGDFSFVVLFISVPLVTFGAYYIPLVYAYLVVFLILIFAPLGVVALLRLVARPVGWYGVGEWKRQVSALYDRSNLPDAQEQVISLLKDWGRTHPSRYPVKGGFSH